MRGDEERQGETRRDEERQGEAKRGKGRQGETRRGEIWRDLAWLGFGLARLGLAWLWFGLPWLWFGLAWLDVGEASWLGVTQLGLAWLGVANRRMGQALEVRTPFNKCLSGLVAPQVGCYGGFLYTF